MTGPARRESAIEAVLSGLARLDAAPETAADIRQRMHHALARRSRRRAMRLRTSAALRGLPGKLAALLSRRPGNADGTLHADAPGVR